MVYGGIFQERICLNELSIWSHSIEKKYVGDDYKALRKNIKELVYAGKYYDAALLDREVPEYDNPMFQKDAKGAKLINGVTASPHAHEVLGNLYLHLPNMGFVETDYRRELDISRAVHTITYNINGVNFTREYFCSNPDNVLVMKLSR